MAKKNLHTKRGLSVDYSSNNVYSYQTHVQHYNRRFGNPAAVASSALQDPRGDRIQGPDFAALSMPAHGRVHAAIFDYYPTATPPDLPLHGHAQGMDRSPYLLDKEVPGTMGLSRSTSRLETTLEDLRENPHIDLLIGSKDRAYSDRFSYNIVPGHHHHHHNSSPSLMISSHSTQSLGSADDYALLPRLPSSQTLGGGPHITSPPSSSLPSGVSSPYMRTALNSYTSEEDLKALFGTTQAALNLTTQRP